MAFRAQLRLIGVGGKIAINQSRINGLGTTVFSVSGMATQYFPKRMGFNHFLNTATFSGVAHTYYKKTVYYGS